MVPCWNFQWPGWESVSCTTNLSTSAPYALMSHMTFGRENTSSTQFGHLRVYFLRGVLTFVGRGLAFNGYILSYFEGKIIYIMLYKLHTDYFSLCQSVILSVLSHEEIYLNICRNVRGVLTFVIHWIYFKYMSRKHFLDTQFKKKKNICHCFPLDTTWHKVKSPKAD